MISDKKYFAAANTVGGFRSYYGEVFGECERIYIIKGGSGTGKSRFMRDFSEYIRKSDRCRSIEHFHCSFDPDSLDGIMINGTVAIIDGTAPHIYEPTLPGAKENIIDLGRFWSDDKLYESKNELLKLFRRKKEHFNCAYGYLGAYGKLDEIKQSITTAYLDASKLNAYASKLVTSLENVRKGKNKVRLISAVGREGKVTLDSFKDAKERIAISDNFGVAHSLINSVISEAGRFDLPITVSYEPLFAYRPNAVMIGDTMSISVSDVPTDHSISEFMSDISAADERKIADINEIQKDLLGKATAEFKAASEVHFDIENIYVSAMDFSKKEAFTAEFLESFRI